MQVVALYFEFDLVFSFDTFIEQVLVGLSGATRTRERESVQTAKFANKGSSSLLPLRSSYPSWCRETDIERREGRYIRYNIGI